jgi:hypothetical protein
MNPLPRRVYEQFSLPHACCECKNVQGFQWITYCRFGKLLSLLSCEGLHFFLGHTRCIDSIANVANNESPSHGGKEMVVSNIVSLPCIHLPTPIIEL